ncbi:hypothetical protein [Cellulosimicrobium funkei]|uniref:hypothetical protein n=1 Tax=Cellulosimicrobium funkei TaxID=264251 RepID=UPI0034433683
MSRRNDDHPADAAASEVAGSVIPGFGWLFGRLSARLRAEWQRNTSTALRVAEGVAGMSREDLEDCIAADPDMIPLYMHVLWAAGMNGHDATLRAMGAALGDAARGKRDGRPDGFEEAEDVLRAMRDFTPRHFRALRYIADHAPSPTDETSVGTFPSTYAKVSGVEVERSSAILANLAAAGLALPGSTFFGGESGYKVTDLGRAVLYAADLQQGHGTV